MSSIYIQEPPTQGKVLLKTSAGDLDIELWSKETPKACRNFIQLCMEGYYDSTIFHRVVKGFIVQGGDPTGTGTGGESIYGKTFRDEFHTRLRFNRRGLVAMANAGKHDNGSQFFITLGQTPELQDKHTIFGKVVGNTLYNLPRFEEGTIDHDDRPEYPHKIIKTEILNNPFSDIEPRVTEQVTIKNEVPREKKRGTKNFSLLSFGDEAEEDEEEVIIATKKLPVKSNSAHDIADDPKLSSEPVSIGEDDALTKVRMKLQNAKKNTEKMIIAEKKEQEENEKNDEKLSKRQQIQSEINSLKKEIRGKRPREPEPEPEEPESSKKSKALQELEDDNQVYVEKKKTLPKKGSARERATQAMLERLSQKINHARDSESGDQEDGWLGHKMLFTEEEPVLAKDASMKDDTWYDLNDPRHAHNKQRREKSKQSSRR